MNFSLQETVYSLDRTLSTAVLHGRRKNLVTMGDARRKRGCDGIQSLFARGERQSLPVLRIPAPLGASVSGRSNWFLGAQPLRRCAVRPQEPAAFLVFGSHRGT